MKKEELNKKIKKYESLFVKESAEVARSGKTIYIRREFHERILKIVHVIGQNEVSIFSYVDNVLNNHFKNFRDEITESYEQKKIRDLF
jgi:hypothetical protein